MPKQTPHVYSIDLDIKTPQASKQTLKELQTALSDSNNSMTELNKTYAELSKNTSDQMVLEKQYNKIIAQRLSEKDKEIDKLNAEKVAIAANKDLTEQQKQDMIALKDAEIKRLATDKKYIKAKEKEAKLLAKMNKVLHSNLDENSKTFKLTKNLVSMQEKLNKLIGKESVLRKAASKAAQVGVKGLKIAGAVGGALIGGAMATAGNAADKARALGSLKRGIDPALVDEVYIKTGADFQSIVAALNNLSDTTFNSGKLVQGAVLELQNPGVGKLLLSGSHRKSSDIENLNNAIAQIKKQTGAADLGAAIEASTKSRLVTSGSVSQIDYLHAYAALAQHGLDEDKINRIIRDTAKQQGNFIENLSKADLSRYVRGQDKTRLGNIDLNLSKLDLGQKPETSAAQSVVEKIRQLELTKDEILAEMLPAALALLQALEPLIQPITKVINWFSKLATDFTGTFVSPIIKELTEILPKVSEGVKGAYADARARDKAIWEWIKGLVPGGANAQGGVITSPSLVGEAGPELVLPLDYSRAGRTSQIINNFNTTQSFNMQSNQSTPLAFSQAVGQNKFVRRTNGL